MQIFASIQAYSWCIHLQILLCYYAHMYSMRITVRTVVALLSQLLHHLVLDHDISSLQYSLAAL